MFKETKENEIYYYNSLERKKENSNKETASILLSWRVIYHFVNCWKSRALNASLSKCAREEGHIL